MSFLSRGSAFRRRIAVAFAHRAERASERAFLLEGSKNCLTQCRLLCLQGGVASSLAWWARYTKITDEITHVPYLND
jgi:hypothetical protein